MAGPLDGRSPLGTPGPRHRRLEQLRVYVEVMNHAFWDHIGDPWAGDDPATDPVAAALERVEEAQDELWHAILAELDDAEGAQVV
jgi:hypothetical protein